MLLIVPLVIHILTHVSSSIIYRSTDFPPLTSGFTEADLVTYFSGLFPVRSQIECCVECLSSTVGSRFYFALYHEADHLCVCHRMLDLPAVQSTSGSTDIKVFQFRGMFLEKSYFYNENKSKKNIHTILHIPYTKPENINIKKIEILKEEEK